MFDVRDIDWTAKTLDIYIDDSLVVNDGPFRDASATGIRSLLLYNFQSPTGGVSEAWWDEIVFLK